MYIENAIYLNFKGLHSFLFNKMKGNHMDSTIYFYHAYHSPRSLHHPLHSLIFLLQLSKPTCYILKQYISPRHQMSIRYAKIFLNQIHLLTKVTMKITNLQACRAKNFKLFNRAILHAKNSLNTVSHAQFEAPFQSRSSFLIPISKWQTDIYNFINL